MTAHSLQELQALQVGAQEGQETPKGLNTKNTCIICGKNIVLPYGRWDDPHHPDNLQSGTCSRGCEDVKDPVSAAFRRLRTEHFSE